LPSLEHVAHAAHAAHILIHEKEKREKKLEQDRHKLSRLKERMHESFNEFLYGKQKRVNTLSREFLRQAIRVHSEKKKLELLDSKLSQLKRARFGTHYGQNS